MTGSVTTLRDKYETIIVGAGIIGSSTAYYLTELGHRDLLIVEREVPCSGSTGRCIGGVRQQFSDELNIRIAMDSVRNMNHVQNDLAVDIQFLQTGYLLLAYTEREMEIFEKNIQLQRSMGLKVDLLTPSMLSNLFPSINTESVLGATFCPTDGQANPFLLVHFYLSRAMESGARLLKGQEVTSIESTAGRITGVRIGERDFIKCDNLINCAGPWARDVAAMAGISIPALPERHESLVTEKIAPLFKPMIVDYTREHGCYFQQKENGAVIGCFTPPEVVPGMNYGVSLDFLQEMSRRMIRLVPELATVSVVRQWSGHYTMTPDAKPIIGPESGLKGFCNVAAFCGHGLMQGPRVGELVAEHIVRGEFSLDLSPMSSSRFENGILTSEELLK
ncbi:MAG: FAD-dependent oxidoreductase [Candidatus Wallbacteria bacterium HGW-Wallbacteria-1]|jgi:sarcosine oxidase subunit beta|uniref:FAD-dependent oxidoreductase n=1 Tax=Candidatus Wallbacteria bacterium HGW-Wallbacteria-1 TaxID=2013854 RepID=A0A2N1PU78_9BACT|nr:MAG: FAD-dependent oxidoreductase [Candidatus Wallbacteria bacterium HGW-Wallbacteria-1]